MSELPINRKAVLGGAVTAMITMLFGLTIAFGLGHFLHWSSGTKGAIATVFAAAGSVLGGFRAGLLHPPAPLANAGFAAGLGYVPVGLLQRILSQRFHVLSFVFSVLFSASIGVFGGFVSNTANRLREQKK
jgi:hypothetical protein